MHHQMTSMSYQRYQELSIHGWTLMSQSQILLGRLTQNKGKSIFALQVSNNIPVHNVGKTHLRMFQPPVSPREVDQRNLQKKRERETDREKPIRELEGQRSKRKQN